jgi:uncharacterized protein YjbI with pentapeptide repeats
MPGRSAALRGAELRSAELRSAELRSAALPNEARITRQAGLSGANGPLGFF